MFKYKYLICTEPLRNKYLVRKNIYLDNKLYSFEDNYYTNSQIHKLLLNLEVMQYKIIPNITL